MIDTVLPPLVAAAALTFTYLFCMRPMLKGRGCHMMPTRAGQSSCHTAENTETATQAPVADAADAEIERLREEVQMLHREVELRSTTTAAPEQAVQLDKGEPR